jgi:uncharacterized protein (TIGR03437 family)
VHDGEKGINGPVTLDSRFGSGPVLIKDGVGNITRLNSLAATAMGSLGSLVTNPEKHYANLHSQANPGGVIRSQTADANTALPVIGAIIAGASEPTIRNVAPGGVASLFGSNFSKTATNLDGVNGTRVPTSMNGTSVTIGGVAAPILLVTPDQINVQVPFNTTTGQMPVVVTNANGASAAFTQTVAAQAPALLFDEVGGYIFKTSDSSLVRPENPVVAGDAIAILCTGLGVTNPAGPTGVILTQDQLLPVAVQPTVTIGGRAAPVAAAVAAPGFIGLYGVIAAVPPGVTSGNQPVIVRSGTIASNSVNIAVK